MGGGRGELEELKQEVHNFVCGIADETSHDESENEMRRQITHPGIASNNATRLTASPVDPCPA